MTFWFIATIVSFLIFVIAANIMPYLKIFQPNREHRKQLFLLDSAFFLIFAASLGIFLSQYALGGV